MVPNEGFDGTAIVTVILGASVVCCFHVIVGAVEMITGTDDDPAVTIKIIDENDGSSVATFFDGDCVELHFIGLMDDFVEVKLSTAGAGKVGTGNDAFLGAELDYRTII